MLLRLRNESPTIFSLPQEIFKLSSEEKEKSPELRKLLDCKKASDLPKKIHFPPILYANFDDTKLDGLFLNSLLFMVRLKLYLLWIQ